MTPDPQTPDLFAEQKPVEPPFVPDEKLLFARDVAAYLDTHFKRFWPNDSTNLET